MAKEHIYTAKEIEDMRSIISVLYFSDESSIKHMSPYERMSIKEEMLQTYLSQGITYYQIVEHYQEKLKEENDKH